MFAEQTHERIPASEVAEICSVGERCEVGKLGRCTLARIANDPSNPGRCARIQTILESIDKNRD